MALAIDTKPLLEVLDREYQGLLPNAFRQRERVQLLRICVYAIIIHDASTRAQFGEVCGSSDPRQALLWQAEQGDDEDEVEVLHHLKQLATTTLAPTKPGISSRPSGLSKAGTTTLVASVESPSFTSWTQDPVLSAFHHFSARLIMESSSPLKFPDFIGFISFPGVSRMLYCPKLLVASTQSRSMDSVIWVVQEDFLDLSRRASTCATSSPGKRRRTVNPFHQVSSTREDDTSRAHHSPEGKIFKGVRYRPERGRWVAEMKPPKSKDKVTFGQFQYQTEAARVVDVAFHHYGKPLNFADTPQILSKQRTSAGLDAEEKLKLVKEQMQWMKQRLPSLLSTQSTPVSGAAGVVASTPNPFEIHSPANTSGLRSFSAIGSSFILGGTDESDDAVSQPGPWKHALTADFDVAHGQEPREQIFDLVGYAGVINNSQDGQSMVHWSAENAIADPSGIGISPEHHSKTLTNIMSSPGVEQPFGQLQSLCMDFCNISPPLSALQVCSPGGNQIDVGDGSLEHQSAGWT